MHIAHALSRLLWGLVAGILSLLVFFMFVPGHVNSSAKESAEVFCESVVIGENIQTVQGKAKEHGAVLTMLAGKSQVIHHQAMFHGFSLSAYTCDINTRSGVVISKGTEAWTS